MKLFDTIKGKKYNLHSHTEFCDGRATMEAFARKALEQGFEVYGFTPHSPVPIVSPCNMLREKTPRYLNEVSRIKNCYADKCLFLAGMEIDYLGEDWGPSHEYFRELNLDYSIGSVHFLPARDGQLIDCDGSHETFVTKMKKYFNDDIRYVVETFYSRVARMIEKGGFDILGHLDKIGDNASFYTPGIEEQSWYASLVDDVISLLNGKNIIVEINTKQYASRNRFFPNERYWDALISRGVKFVVNSDSHVPALIDASRDTAINLLEKHLHKQP